MVTKFEETGSLNVRSGRGKKPVSAEAIEKVALQVEEEKSSNVLVSTSVRRVKESLNLPRSAVQKIMQNILRYYPYKLQFVQELLPYDFETRYLISLQFLARLKVDPEKYWNILWTDEAHFHLDGSVNTHNCRIWETDNPHSILRVPLHSTKVTVGYGFSASFILGLYFFEELGAGGPVTCSLTGQRYASLLRNKIIPDLQALQCLSRIIFMQDGAPPHITRCVTDVLKHHFTEERGISREFRHLWPLRSPDLKSCDFWLWGHLKQLASEKQVGRIDVSAATSVGDDMVVARCWQQWITEGSVDWNFADLGQRSVTDWRRVIFSDESRFSLSADDHRTRVWRRTSQRSDPAFIVEQHTAISQGVTVWGAISWDTRSSLVVLQGTLTARRYVDDILTPIVLPMLSSRPGAIYQQDNARPHTARLSQQCLQGYHFLPWPARSPDLSPIEHVWTRWEGNCSRPEIQEN
ncbi:transposable element tc3 transposase [Trichonephila clavipes]|nr:transposable element tc3 transposase [Trichonephila clavipes]